MMNLVKSKKSGFTLIEMLVVIAIIALLAAILVPTVTNALDNANRTRALSNGRGIYQAIFAAHLETINFPPTVTIWPTSDEDATSTAYFERLMDPDEQILSQDFGLFSASGFPAARDLAGFTQANNSWVVTDGATNSSTSQLPFLITRNLEDSSLVDSSDRIETVSGPPYEDRALVVVRVGGGGEVIPNRALRWNNLNPAGATNDLLRP